MKKNILFLLILSMAVMAVAPVGAADRLTVVASVFPLYEFSREVAGPDADVALLLPPGVEPHTWEPRPSDIIKVSRAAVFLTIGPSMEPWAADIVRAVSGRDVETVQVLELLALTGQGPGSASGHPGIDPHFWLDLSLAARAVESLGDVFAARDPVHAPGFRKSAAAYSRRLRELDRLYEETLSRCRTKTFVVGGHGAFGYLAKRYNLEQVSLYGLNPDAEPTPAHLAEVITLMQRENLKVVYFEEMVSPRLSRVLAQETGAAIRVLNPGGNITARDQKEGATFLRIMEANLVTLGEGLGCE